MEFTIGTIYTKQPNQTRWKYLGVIFSPQFAARHVFCSVLQEKNSLVIPTEGPDAEKELKTFVKLPAKRNVNYEVWFENFLSPPVPYVGQLGGRMKIVSITLSEDMFVLPKVDDWQDEDAPIDVDAEFKHLIDLVKPNWLDNFKEHQENNF